MSRVIRAAVAVALAGTGVACTGGSGDNSPGSGGVRIVYRVEDRTQSPPLVTTQVVETDPPYVARLITRTGPPPGGAQTGGTIWTRDRQYVVDPSGEVRELADVVPSFAGPDAHLDVSLPVAARLGLVSRVGSGKVAGVTCTQWRSRSPLDTAPFRAATTKESTVSCVDEEGRLLSDEWTLGGDVVRERTAVEIGHAAALGKATLFGDRTPQPQPTPVSTTSVKPEPPSKLSAALGIGELPAPPGFAFDRSLALIDVDRASATPQVINEGAGFSWVNGDQLVTLVIRRGLRAPLPEPREGVPVALGANGRGRLAPVFTGLRLQLRTAQGLVVTATGDVAESTLRAWVSALPLA